MKYLLILLFSITAIGLQAQIKFNITSLSDNETYLVSLISDETIEAPFNKVSNLQVVVKSEKNNPLDAIQLESLIPGVVWSNDAYFDNSSSRDAYKLTAFTATPSYIGALNIEADTELPLFTMKRTDGNCIGRLTLPHNNDQAIITAIQHQLNLTQSITILGKRGNAFSHLLNTTMANCDNGKMEADVLSTDFTLAAYPVPAKNNIQMEWTSNHRYNNLKADIFNNKAQLLQSILLPSTKGRHLQEIDLSTYSAGLYTLRLTTDELVLKTNKFIIQK
ncbi:MAG: T9SS type A sorting domain-containing protein [Saprospiraceae bacterium]